MNRKNTLTWWVAILLVMFGIATLAMRRDNFTDIAASNAIWRIEPFERDLDVIKGDTLRVLVLSDPLCYEARPKAVIGLEWELMERFARQHQIAVKPIPMDHLDSMVLALQQGRGDVILAQMTPRRDRRKYVAFTSPYRMVRPMLASLREDPLSKKGHVARSDTAEMSAWSPFADPDFHFDTQGRRRLPLQIDHSITPEDLLLEVVLGKHGSTVITDARASYEAGRFPLLQFTGPIGPAQPLCFAVRKNAPGLLSALNNWLEKPEEREARTQFAKAYSNSIPNSGPMRPKKITLAGDRISPFDEYFRKSAQLLPWEWELLAAIAYKESRFDTVAISNMGAQGLMQIMPQTAARFGLAPNDHVKEHIRAAGEYLSKLDEMWRRAITDRDERLKFVLASYNAGPGHIIDAQRLAQKLGLDPNKWDQNVERAILLKAKPRYFMLPEMKNGYCIGSQVFNYVRDIVGMYHQLRTRPRSSNSELISAIPESAAE
jgi:membrane-bound lytic murein transglycosylase F